MSADAPDYTDYLAPKGRSLPLSGPAPRPAPHLRVRDPAPPPSRGAHRPAGLVRAPIGVRRRPGRHFRS